MRQIRIVITEDNKDRYSKSLKLSTSLKQTVKLLLVRIIRQIVMQYQSSGHAMYDTQVSTKLCIVVALLLLFSIQSLSSRTTMVEKRAVLLVIAIRV